MYFLESPYLFLCFLFLSVFFFLSILIFLSNKKEIDNVLFFLVGIFLIFFWGNRTNGSPDTYMYLQTFYHLDNLQEFSWSPPFFYLMKGISYFGEEAEFYLLGSTAIFTFILMYAIHNLCLKYSSKSLMLCLYGLNWSVYDLVTNTYRQGIAAALVFCSISLYLRKRYFLSYVFMLISIGFHWSAALILLFSLISLWISRFSDKSIKILLFLIFVYMLISIVFKMGISVVIGKFDALFDLVNMYTGYDIGNKQNSYLNNGVVGARFYDYSYLKRIFSLLDFIVPLSLSLLLVLNRLKKVNNDERLILSFFIVLSFYFLFLLDMTWFFRNMYWLVLFSPIIFVLYICRFKIEQSDLSVNDISKIKKLESINLFLWSFLFLFVSIVTLWRSEIMKLNTFVSF